MSVVQTYSNLRDSGDALASRIPRPRVAGQFVSVSALNGLNTTTAAVTAGTLRFIPVILARRMTIDRIGTLQTSFAAGTSQCGIYANTFTAGSDVPGNRLVSASYSTAAAPSDAAISFTFESGVLYWLAHVQSVSVICANLQPGSMASLARSSATQSFTHRTATGTTLPLVAPATTLATGQCVAVYVREV